MSVLSGLSVLIVEDNPVLMLDTETALVELGCDVAGVAGRLADARELIRAVPFDLAVLDVNIQGEKIDPVAESIARSGRPIVFVTGYGAAGVPLHIPGPVIERPYARSTLERALLEAMQAERE